MGLYDRDYTQADFESRHHYSPHMRINFPKVTPVVKWLLIINIVVFLVGFIIPQLGRLFLAWFSVWPKNFGTTLQLWRLITYQFLHGGLWHIFINMIVLFFFGSMLEGFWGDRKFLTFYLICGAMGGIFYPILVHIGWLDGASLALPLVGASGSILGMLAAAALLFPKMRLFVYGIFPVRVTLLAMIFAVISILSVLRPDISSNVGGEAAHLGGMVAGAVYVLSEKWRRKLKMKVRTGTWEKKMAGQRGLQMEVDRILQKVHSQGMHSLTRQEKKTLKQATKAEQMRNRL